MAVVVVEAAMGSKSAEGGAIVAVKADVVVVASDIVSGAVLVKVVTCETSEGGVISFAASAGFENTASLIKENVSTTYPYM